MGKPRFSGDVRLGELLIIFSLIIAGVAAYFGAINTMELNAQTIQHNDEEIQELKVEKADDAEVKALKNEVISQSVELDKKVDKDLFEVKFEGLETRVDEIDDKTDQLLKAGIPPQ